MGDAQGEAKADPCQFLTLESKEEPKNERAPVHKLAGKGFHFVNDQTIFTHGTKQGSWRIKRHEYQETWHLGLHQRG